MAGKATGGRFVFDIGQAILNTVVVPDLVDRLTKILGDDACLRDPERQERYVVDWRGMYRGRAPAVLRPRTTGDVARIVKLCAEAGVGIVPQGGNTGLVGGAAPSRDGTEVILSLERLNQVREIDRYNQTMVAEAGCILQTLQEAAEREGRYFPLSLGAEGSCQIGGNIATNAGGNAVLRYGNARDLVLGLEVVLPDGTIWNGLKGLRKNNTGYDLKQLFIGSEGTLGIITAATLKLYPARRQIEAALVAFDALDTLMALFDRVRAEADAFLTAFELIPRIGIDMALEHVRAVKDPLSARYPFYALVELSSSQTRFSLRTLLEDMLGGMMSDGLVRDGVVAESRQQAAELWLLREACVEAQRLAGPSFKHDVSVPISRIPDLVGSASAAVRRIAPDTRIVAFGHVGDGNVHFNVCIGKGQSAEAFLRHGAAITKAIYEVVEAMDGSFSAEHGVGLLKRDALHAYVPALAVGLMQKLKGCFDPAGLLNPGKVLGDPSDGR